MAYLLQHISSGLARNEKNVRIFVQVTTNCQTLALSFRLDHGTIARTREHASGKERARDGGSTTGSSHVSAVAYAATRETTRVGRERRPLQTTKAGKLGLG